MNCIEKFLFRITHAFRVEKSNGHGVVMISEKGKWYIVKDKRFLSKKNALSYMEEIKMRGYV